MVFDRYEDCSIKRVTRTAQRKEASRHHQLSHSINVSPQKVVLAVTYNKLQLDDVIVETLLAQKQQLVSTNHKLLVTGRDPVPVEICRGMTIRREDVRNVHEQKQKKVWFYIALYPVHWTAQSALHFPPLAYLFIPTPFSASLGSILAMQQLRNDYSLTFPPLSIARYSFIQLSRLKRREVKENAQTSKRYQRGFEPGLSRLIASPAFYH